MRKLIVFSLFVVMVFGLSWAEGNNTRIEQFINRADVLTVQRFDSLGMMKGDYSTIRISAVKVYEYGKENSVVNGIRITITHDVSPYGNANVYIDADEVASLIKALNNIIELNNGLNSGEYADAVMMTRGGYSLQFFYGSRGGEFLSSIGTVNSTIFKCSMSELSKLIEIFEKFNRGNVSEETEPPIKTKAKAGQ